ncbi:microtubule-associated protein futsch-like isoform X2 [Aphidius gifuensis]|uniref:microtubule-associated protein futsch-like isoform X2 n=1 Tax=Aphidius gifuensis TaxID=684658 RepID=UPI001CDD5CEB|nr:microtubule-associated protein futsch-like isoform X2 [Aphidius gifuensis]
MDLGKDKGDPGDADKSSVPLSDSPIMASTIPGPHPPPSPLSGCYLLVVLPEPHTAQHKDLILNRVAKGFLSWDKDSVHVDLEKELQALVAQSPEGEEARNGERLIQYATENLVTEILIHPQINTLLQCIRNLLASFTKHRHIIHAGYTFGENGSWILQDGTFSVADFLDAFSEHDVQRVLRAYENSITVDINCCEIGEWSTKRFTKEQCTRSCRVRLNPDDILTRDLSAIINFTKYIEQYLVPQTLDELMKPSDVVGNIRFSHPTLYVFPGGQGDAALFGINGFNMLVDGGFSRKSCFWDFTRHLDRLDAVLLTRINNSNAVGMSSILKKKHDMQVYPQIGHFFCNLVERKNNDLSTNNYDDPLILSLTKIGQDMMLNLKHINLQPHPCYRHPDPINLYHKVGHGTLDMYVLSPNKDSREVREFLTKWKLGDCKIFENSHKKDNNIINFPIQNMISICALLIWQPANPNDTITRILFPGSTPQNKIFEGMEKLKHLEFLKYSTCTAKTISSSSTTSMTTSTIIQGIKDTNNKPIKHKLASLERDTTTTTTTTATKRYSSNSNNNTTEMRKQKRETKTETNDKVEKIHEKNDKIIDVKSTKKSMTNENNKKIDTNIDENKTNKLIIEKKDKELKKTEITKIEKTGIKDTTKISSNKNDKKGKDDTTKEQQQQLPQRFITGKTGETKIISDKKIKDKPITKKDTTRSNVTSTKQEQQKMTSSTTTATTKSTAKSSTKTFSAAPKSTKDANNRKVLEQKNNEKTTTMTSRATSAKQKPAPPIASEKKPVPRRPRPTAASSPSKTRSPIKSVKNPVVHRTEKDSAIRRIKTDKGIIDTSTSSTPSAIEPDSLIKYTDKCLTEKSEDMSLDSIESKVLADMKEERQVVEEIEAVLQKAERIEGTQKIDDEITVDITGDKKDLTEDMTEDDVTADIDEIPNRKSPTSKISHEQFTEDDDEYLIIEKEEIYTEDSVQSGDHEKKHYLDAVESEKIKIIDKKIESEEEEEEEFDGDDEEESGAEEKEVAEEKGIIEDREKSIDLSDKKVIDEKIKSPIIDDDDEQNKISSTNEIIKKSDDKDDSGKKDSDDLKEITSLSPEKLDSSEKKTDTDIKPDIDLKMKEKLEESQERISTIESGQTTTAPTLPEDERMSVDVIKPTTIEKPILEDKKIEITKPKEIVPLTSDIPQEIKPDIKTFNIRQTGNVLQRDIVKTPDEVADLPVHEEVDPHLYKMDDDFEKPKEEKSPPSQQDVKVTAPTVQDVKVPSPKEQKGFQSFFGSIADKFEKGMDKLTGKTRGDSDKDIDEKSSSKSGSPKEDKRQIPIVTADTQIVSEEIKKIELSPQKSPVDDQSKQKELHIEEKSKDIAKTVEAPEDLEDVEALIEEASKKFKTVKDSLHDSLESLEDKLAEEEFKRSKEMAENIKDEIQGTLDEVVGKLEQIRPEFEIPKESDEIKLAVVDSTKVLQDKDDVEEEEEEEESDIPFKNVKGAVLDVGGVLAGTAGILIEEKPKDVVEIVKKVAEVLSEDDFLSNKILFKDDDGKYVEKSMDKKSPEQTEIQEELCRKKSSASIADLASPSKEIMSDKDAAKAMCKDLLKEDIIMTKSSDDIHDYGVDVVTAGIEEICHKVQLPEPEEKPSTEFDPSEIIMEHKKAPDTAEHVIVSPDSQPPSPKYPTDKIQSKSDEKDEIETVISHHENITEIIEELVFIKNKKITIEIIEYIRVIKRVTREHVINIIEEIILKKNIPRNYVVDDGVLDDESIEHEDEIEASIASEKLLADIESEIINEYVMKNKKITKTIIEEIHIRRKIPIRIVIEIIESIVLMRKIRRQSIVDVADTVWNELKSTVEIESDLEDEQEDKPDDKIPEKIEIDSSIIDEATRTNIEQEIVTEYVDKQKKITETVIEEIHTRHKIPVRIVIEIIEHIVLIRKISRHSIVDVADADWNVMKNSNEYKIKPEEKEKDKPIVSDAIKSEIESIIMNEYIRHEKKITANNIEEIHMKKNIPIKIIIEVIDRITITKKIPRKSIVDFSETIWEELKASKPLKIDTKEEEEKELLDSFVHVQSNDTIEKVNLQTEKTDDFEAVEQEYKVTGIKELIVKDKITDEYDDDEEEEEEEEEEDGYESEGDLSEIIEADEKLADDILDDNDDNKIDPDKLKPSDKIKVDIKDEKINIQDENINKLSTELDESNEAPTVKRMIVTATSEDGGEEIEVCPSGSITFTKSASPDDSLRASPVKTTIDKDSLQSTESFTDKDSLDKTSINDSKTFDDSIEKSTFDDKKTNIPEMINNKDNKELYLEVDSKSLEQFDDSSPAESVFDVSLLSTSKDLSKIEITESKISLDDVKADIKKSPESDVQSEKDKIDMTLDKSRSSSISSISIEEKVKIDEKKDDIKLSSSMIDAKEKEHDISPIKDSIENLNASKKDSSPIDEKLKDITTDIKLLSEIDAKAEDKKIEIEKDNKKSDDENKSSSSINTFNVKDESSIHQTDAIEFDKVKGIFDVDEKSSITQSEKTFDKEKEKETLEIRKESPTTDKKLDDKKTPSPLTDSDKQTVISTDISPVEKINLSVDEKLDKLSDIKSDIFGIDRVTTPSPHSEVVKGDDVKQVEAVSAESSRDISPARKESISVEKIDEIKKEIDDKKLPDQVVEDKKLLELHADDFSPVKGDVLQISRQSIDFTADHLEKGKSPSPLAESIKSAISSGPVSPVKDQALQQAVDDKKSSSPSIDAAKSPTLPQDISSSGKDSLSAEEKDKSLDDIVGQKTPLSDAAKSAASSRDISPMRKESIVQDDKEKLDDAKLDEKKIDDKKITADKTEDIKIEDIKLPQASLGDIKLSISSQEILPIEKDKILLPEEKIKSSDKIQEKEKDEDNKKDMEQIDAIDIKFSLQDTKEDIKKLSVELSPSGLEDKKSIEEKIDTKSPSPSISEAKSISSPKDVSPVEKMSLEKAGDVDYKKSPSPVVESVKSLAASGDHSPIKQESPSHDDKIPTSQLSELEEKTKSPIVEISKASMSPDNVLSIRKESLTIDDSLKLGQTDEVIDKKSPSPVLEISSSTVKAPDSPKEITSLKLGQVEESLDIKSASPTDKTGKSSASTRDVSPVGKDISLQNEPEIFSQDARKSIDLKLEDLQVDKKQSTSPIIDSIKSSPSSNEISIDKKDISSLKEVTKIEQTDGATDKKSPSPIAESNKSSSPTCDILSVKNESINKSSSQSIDLNIDNVQIVNKSPSPAESIKSSVSPVDISPVKKESLVHDEPLPSIQTPRQSIDIKLDEITTGNKSPSPIAESIKSSISSPHDLSPIKKDIKSFEHEILDDKKLNDFPIHQLLKAEDKKIEAIDDKELSSVLTSDVIKPTSSSSPQDIPADKRHSLVFDEAVVKKTEEVIVSVDVKSDKTPEKIITLVGESVTLSSGSDGIPQAEKESPILEKLPEDIKLSISPVTEIIKSSISPQDKSPVEKEINDPEEKEKSIDKPKSPATSQDSSPDKKESMVFEEKEKDLDGSRSRSSSMVTEYSFDKKEDTIHDKIKDLDSIVDIGSSIILEASEDISKILIEGKQEINDGKKYLDEKIKETIEMGSSIISDISKAILTTDIKHEVHEADKDQDATRSRSSSMASEYSFDKKEDKVIDNKTDVKSNVDIISSTAEEKIISTTEVKDKLEIHDDNKDLDARSRSSSMASEISVDKKDEVKKEKEEIKSAIDMTASMILEPLKIISQAVTDVKHDIPEAEKDIGARSRSSSMASEISVGHQDEKTERKEDIIKSKVDMSSSMILEATKTKADDKLDTQEAQKDLEARSRSSSMASEYSFDKKEEKIINKVDIKSTVEVAPSTDEEKITSKIQLDEKHVACDDDINLGTRSRSSSVASEFSADKKDGTTKEKEDIKCVVDMSASMILEPLKIISETVSDVKHDVHESEKNLASRSRSSSMASEFSVDLKDEKLKEKEEIKSTIDMTASMILEPLKIISETVSDVKHDIHEAEKTLASRSRSSSMASEFSVDLKEKQDDKSAVDMTASMILEPSKIISKTVTDVKYDIHEAEKDIGARSRSSSMASEISVGHQDEKTEKKEEIKSAVDMTTSMIIEPSKIISKTVTDVKHDTHDEQKDIAARSRSSSMASEISVDKKDEVKKEKKEIKSAIDMTASVILEPLKIISQAVTDVKHDLQDEQKDIGARSRSSSMASEISVGHQDEKTERKEDMIKSKVDMSSSMVLEPLKSNDKEKHDIQEEKKDLASRSRSSSIASVDMKDEKTKEKSEIKSTVDMSSSIIMEKPKTTSTSETKDTHEEENDNAPRSRSSSMASEYAFDKKDEKIDMTSSMIFDKPISSKVDDKKDIHDDDKDLASRSRSSSMASEFSFERKDEKTIDKFDKKPTSTEMTSSIIVDTSKTLSKPELELEHDIHEEDKDLASRSRSSSMASELSHDKKDEKLDLKSNIPLHEETTSKSKRESLVSEAELTLKKTPSPAPSHHEDDVIHETPSRDRSRSHSLFESAEKLPIGRSRAASLFEDDIFTKSTSRKSSGLADFHEEHHTESSTKTTVKDDFEDSITNRKDVERYIISQYVSRKKKINKVTFEEIVSLYDVPSYIVIEIIHGICDEGRIRRESVIDSDLKVEDYSSEKIDNVKESEMSYVKRIDTENYITDEYIRKNKKINWKIIEEISIIKGINVDLILEIIEYLIVQRKITRESLIDDDVFGEQSIDKKSTVIKEVEKEEEEDEEDDDDEIQREKSSRVYSDVEHSYPGELTPPEYDSRKENIQRQVFDDTYESQFHKAFVGGMTEIRTTHITTLSGKTTPDVGTRVDTPDSFTDSVASGTTEKILKETKIQSEPLSVKQTIVTESQQQEQQQTEYETIVKRSDPIVIKRTIVTDEGPEYQTVVKTIEPTIIKRTVVNEDEPEYETQTIIKKTIVREVIEGDDDDDDDDVVNDDEEIMIDDYKGISKAEIDDKLSQMMSKSLGQSSSGRSTPDRIRDSSVSRASTGTPDSFCSSEVIRTTITKTRTVSGEGEIITTTKEVTETTNERGETVVLEEKIDVKTTTAETGIDTSQQQQKQQQQHDESDEEEEDPLSGKSQIHHDDKKIDFTTADMSSSFYGKLPDVPQEIRHNIESESKELTTKKSTIEEKIESSSSTVKKVITEVGGSGGVAKELKEEHDKDDDPLKEWGTPLKLPSPEKPQKFNLRTTPIVRNSIDMSPDSLNFDVINNWGEPLRLPSPAPTTTTTTTDDASNKNIVTTPKKEKKQPINKIVNENIKNNKKRSDSPAGKDKKKEIKIQPVYLDLTYVPHHGNSYYASLDFFKRIRARYYVFSGTEPSREVYDALLDAKKTWENKSLEVTMIPTYDTDTLGYWVADNEEALAANHIDLSPSASRCTINLQDHETSCSAYRLEF